MGIRSRRLAVYAAIALTAVATPLGIVVGNASAAADPTAGFTPYTSGYKVQNWTSRPLSQTFTITGGVININVRSGERRVEMAWDRWTNQGREPGSAPPHWPASCSGAAAGPRPNAQGRGPRRPGTARTR